MTLGCENREVILYRIRIFRPSDHSPGLSKDLWCYQSLVTPEIWYQ